jgi:excisionase family DNA binding protein
MSEPAKNPFDLLLDQIRAVVAEEIGKALSERKPAKLLFSTDEAAQMLNVKKSLLANRVRAGEVPYRRSGHRIYFAQQDIDEIVAQSAVVPKNGKG